MVYTALNTYTPIEVAQGGAYGTDKYALMWCIENNVKHQTFNADWNKFGKAAGPIRNRKMIEEFKPDYVLAFPGGPGTLNCKTEAKKKAIKVIEVN
jgi:hypothetical protein